MAYGLDTVRGFFKARAPAPSAAGYGPVAARPRGGQYAEIGVTGIVVSSGQVVEPVAALRDLTPFRARELYQEMFEEDATVWACCRAVILVLLSVAWRYKPANDTPRAQEMADFATGLLFEDMSHTFAEAQTDVYTEIVHGFSFLEMVYKRREGRNPADPTRNSRFTDGKVGLRKLAPRAQWTITDWRFDDAGGVQAAVQRPPNGGSSVDIPIERGLLFRTDRAMGSPEGVSWLRPVRRPWAERKFLGQLEVQQIERDTTGLPILGVPKEILDSMGDGAQQAAGDDPVKLAELARNRARFSAAQNLVQHIKQGAQTGLLLSTEPYRDDQNKPSGERQWSYAQVGSPGTRATDVKGARADRRTEIMVAFFAQFFLLGVQAGGTGSRSTSQDHTDFFLQACQHCLSSSRDVFQRHMLPRVWALNGLPDDLMPLLEHDPIKSEDVAKVMAGVQAAAAAGIVVNDPNMTNWVRRQLGAPELEEEDLMRAEAEGFGQFGPAPGLEPGAEPAPTPPRAAQPKAVPGDEGAAG